MLLIYNAEVVELVDAHDSGSCEGNLVEVRVFSSAPPSSEGGCEIPLISLSALQEVVIFYLGPRPRRGNKLLHDESSVTLGGTP